MSLNTILATAPLTATGYHLKATGTALGQSLIWDNGTNVGIGNTNTSYTLDVSGTIRGTTSVYFATASGSVGIGTVSPENILTLIKNTTAATENTYGLSIQSVNTNAYTELLLGASDAVDAGIIQTASKNTNFTAKNLSLQPQGGNVLIGTTANAGYKLDVSGTGRFTSSLTSDTLLVNAAAQANVTALIQGKVATTGTALKVISDGNGTDKVFEFTGSDGTAAQTMTMLQSGLVGIGTSSPLNVLDVRQASAIMGNYQTIQAFSTDSAAINLGGGISLGGYFTGTTSIAQFGSIVGRKENSTSGNYDGYLAFGTNAQATGVVERMRISSSGVVSLNAADATYISFAYLGTNKGFIGVAGTLTDIISGAAAGDLTIRAQQKMQFATGGDTPRMTITSGGNVLIGTTTDSSYKLAVASGHQYLGTGFQITGTFGQVDRQCATAFADFSGPTVTFDLASIFPRTTFLNRGLSVTMQLVALPTYTIVSSAFVVLARTGNSNVWSSAILANININGAVISTISATGTVITIVYNTHIFGTAYINLATIG